MIDKPPDPWARLRARRDPVVRNHPTTWPLARLVLTVAEFDALMDVVDERQKPTLRSIEGGRP